MEEIHEDRQREKKRTDFGRGRLGIFAAIKGETEVPDHFAMVVKCKSKDFLV